MQGAGGLRPDRQALGREAERNAGGGMAGDRRQAPRAAGAWRSGRSTAIGRNRPRSVAGRDRAGLRRLAASPGPRFRRGERHVGHGLCARPAAQRGRTGAFGAQFGASPEQRRARGLDGLTLQEPRLRIAPARYAAFDHPGHVTTIRATYHGIWDRWLMRSGHVAAEAVSLERHHPTFDPRTGLGGLEVWIPLEA